MSYAEKLTERFQRDTLQNLIKKFSPNQHNSFYSQFPAAIDNSSLVRAINVAQDIIQKHPESWPKRITIYLHSSKESNYEIGASLGFAGDTLRTFSYTGYECAIEYEVKGSGEARAISFDGRKIE